MATIAWVSSNTIPPVYTGRAGLDRFTMARVYMGGNDYVTLSRNGYPCGRFIGFDEAKAAAHDMVAADAKRAAEIRAECERPIPYGC